MEKLSGVIAGSTSVIEYDDENALWRLYRMILSARKERGREEGGRTWMREKGCERL